MPGGAGGDAAALCAQAYIGAHCKTWSAKYAQQWGHTLAQHVYPVIGAMPVGRACAGWRMKALKEHRVALTEVAQRLLAAGLACPRLGGRAGVFVSRRPAVDTK